LGIGEIIMEIKETLDLIHYVEKLKDELRHNWTSKDRQESVAEHCWRMSVMALLLLPKLDKKISSEKVMKMISIHDFGEIVAGDVPAQDSDAKKQQEIIEKDSMIKLKQVHNDPITDEIFSLWEEYEKRETLEAKFVKALDKLEVRIQHNESPIQRWSDIEFERSQYVADKFVEYDSFLKEFNKLVKKESAEKIKNESDKNFEEILEKVESALK
jgi:putative hydrolases of HD superfamily